MTNDKPSISRTKIFISYSRGDRATVLELVDRLSQEPTLQVLLDTEDVLPTEEWKKRLTDLIAAADTVVFCLSPRSATSKVCAWEVATAESFNKRIAPFVIAKVDGSVPSGLSKFNYINADSPAIFEEGIAVLLRALETDIAWIREHTRLGDLARRWREAGQPRHDLLRGAAIDAAEQWTRYRPSTAPELTSDTVDFLEESREEDVLTSRRQRRTLVSLIALSLSLFTLIGLGYTGFLDATYLEGRFNGVLNQWRDKKLKVGAVTRDCWSASCPEMVLLPGGHFIMGSPPDEVDRVKDEEPQRKITIAYQILISKYEVTFDEWEACYRAGGCSFVPSDFGWGRGRRPVAGIAWNDIQQYLSWMSRKTGMIYRLLSEAEWEYAARGISSSDAQHFPFVWGAQFQKGRANCLTCAYQPANQTLPVGSYPPNAFGLHDMIGNVWEWVQDCYVDDYSAAPTNGSAVLGRSTCSRVLRGGSFNTGAKFVRPAYRNRQLASQGSRNFGFRVARAYTTSLP